MRAEHHDARSRVVPQNRNLTSTDFQSPDDDSKIISRRDRRRAEIREKLIKAALSLFQTRGLEATTIGDITEAADLGKGTFYNYFRSKNEIALAVSEWDPLQFAEDLKAVEEGRKTVQQIFEELACLHRDMTPTYMETLFSLSTNEESREKFWHAREISRKRMIQLIKVGQKHSEITTDLSPEEIATVVQVSVWGGLILGTMRPTFKAGEWPEVDFVWRTIWPAMCAKKPDGRSHLPKVARARRPPVLGSNEAGFKRV